MNKTHVSWGIIGCGDVTEIKSGPAFNKVPQSSLVAVMRRNEALAKDYAERHQVPAYYSDAALLIADENVDAVYIATPPHVHEAYALDCIRAGKPVYVEKPMTLNFATAISLQKAVQDAGGKLVLAHYRRAQPMFLKLKELVDTGAVGKPLYVYLSYRRRPADAVELKNPKTAWRHNPAVSGGGLFHDLAPHQLGIMYFLFGEPLKAQGFSANTGTVSAADDMVSGQVLFDHGLQFTGNWCFNVHPQDEADSCSIFGTEGNLSFSFFNATSILLCNAKGRHEFAFEPLQHVQQPMIERAVQYFLDNAENPCPCNEGVAVMKMMDCFTGKRWEDLSELAL